MEWLSKGGSMKCVAKVCKCGRIFKWGKWYRFEELPNNDKIEMLKAHNQGKIQELIEPCPICDVYHDSQQNQSAIAV
jgi:hypothetical protein